MTRDVPAQASGVAVARVLRGGTSIVIDDVDRADDDTRASLLQAAQALGEGSASLILVGADDALLERLAPWARHTCALRPLTLEQITSLLRAHGARADDDAARALLAASEGRAADAAALAATLAATPELSLADLLLEVRPRTRVPARRAALWDAVRALDEGAPRRAASIVRSLFGNEPFAALTLSSAGLTLEDAHVEPALVLARAELASGQLASAVRLFDALDARGALSAERKLEHARALERVGSLPLARALAESLAAADPTVAGAALALAAAVAIAQGQPHDAESLASAALASAASSELRSRLLSTRSDAALRLHDASAALAHAEGALDEARRSESPSALAHALSRRAAAHAMSGRNEPSRADYASALALAEQVADPSALPPYIMNLATADHSAGDVSAALLGYERAARLAGRVGREATRASALSNLVGLLIFVGADGDAAGVLADARLAAERAGQRFFSAQSELLEAELFARRDPARARALARGRRGELRAPRRCAAG